MQGADTFDALKNATGCINPYFNKGVKINPSQSIIINITQKEALCLQQTFNRCVTQPHRSKGQIDSWQAKLDLSEVLDNLKLIKDKNNYLLDFYNDLAKFLLQNRYVPTFNLLNKTLCSIKNIESPEIARACELLYQNVLDKANDDPWPAIDLSSFFLDAHLIASHAAINKALYFISEKINPHNEDWNYSQYKKMVDGLKFYDNRRNADLILAKLAKMIPKFKTHELETTFSIISYTNDSAASSALLDAAVTALNFAANSRFSQKNPEEFFKNLLTYLFSPEIQTLPLNSIDQLFEF
ncbi:hypothetical protein [Paraburkholderia hayleyella]|uniref:hypothetical protein n=1 Tax=Paraburkholderia hayleyella TaxID=2152889 RepID=UPI001292AEFB|nr:hypothetical protein [Paraburkholderia hayleyella]